MTDWDDLVAFKCSKCGVDAIENLNSSHGAARECRDCHYVPVLEDDDRDDRPRENYELTSFSSRRSASCGGQAELSSEERECRMGESPARRRREDEGRTAPTRPEHREPSGDRPRSGQGALRGSSFDGEASR